MNLKRCCLVWLLPLCFLTIVAMARGQASSASIRYDAASRIFRIDAADVTYVLGINEKKELQALYWGTRLAADDPFMPAHSRPGSSAFDIPVNATAQEFVAWGQGLYVEPNLKVSFPDGNRDVVLEYISHSIENDTLTIVLKDISREVYVAIEYKVDGATGILRRSARVENKTAGPITIEQISAATWNLPRGTDYQLRYLTGRWDAEWNLEQQPVRPGKTVLESRRGSTGSQNNPWFAIESGSSQDEDFGNVWFGALGWSGSWQITVEQDTEQQVRVTGGPNVFDFAYHLAKGKQLQTPYFYGGFSHEGIGGASRLLHSFELSSIVPHAPNPVLRPVLYNSWESTEFNVNEAGQEALAEKAATLGVERFVIDDGWFGERANEHAGLGDWYVNPVKFPQGLKPLIDKVHSLGMDFGIWVEPEMVNANSDLYRKHPDWVLNFTGRPRTEGRNQLVLNLARPDVRAYVAGFLDKLLTENDIAFLKIDYNRNWSEPGWPAVAPEDQKNVYIDFIRNFYSILEELRAKHPKVEVETCSGGGSRVDLGILRYAEQAWPSDNTDAFDRLRIQNGFTYGYAPGIMVTWVTDSPTGENNRTLSLDYRFLSGMQGAMGLGADLNKWKPEDFVTAKKLIAQYKQIRPIVQRGQLYRLVSPLNGSEYSVTESVSRDRSQAVVFAFLHSSQMTYPYPRVYLRGLEEHATYRLEALDGQVAGGTPGAASGTYWMQHGVDVELHGDFQAAAFLLQKQ
jgi:alpha-galactosidase